MIGVIGVLVVVSGASAQTPVQDIQQKAVDLGRQLLGGARGTEPAAGPIMAPEEMSAGGPLIAPAPTNAAAGAATRSVDAATLRAREQELRQRALEVRNTVMAPAPGEATGTATLQARETIENVIQERRELQALRATNAAQETAQKRLEYENRVQESVMAADAELQSIQDEAKRQAARTIVENLYAVKERMLNQFMSALGQMGVVLTNITTRTDKAVEAGILTEDKATEVYDAVDAARADIAQVQEQVLAGFDVAYNLSVENDDALRDALETVRNAMRTTLTRLRNAVQNAHDMVRAAAVLLAQEPQVDEAD